MSLMPGNAHRRCLPVLTRITMYSDSDGFDRPNIVRDNIQASVPDACETCCQGADIVNPFP